MAAAAARNAAMVSAVASVLVGRSAVASLVSTLPPASVAPVIARKARCATSNDRAMIPTVSKLGASGTTPSSRRISTWCPVMAPAGTVAVIVKSSTTDSGVTA